jgi:hypothetical protein
VPLWGFAALPLLGWAWQEAAERVLEVESFPFAATREPAFLKGLGVQVLFGIVALLVAWRQLALVRGYDERGPPPRR